jgi:hypothetical protein
LTEFAGWIRPRFFNGGIREQACVHHFLFGDFSIDVGARLRG